MTEFRDVIKESFQYYITDLSEGAIRGTNIERVAVDYSTCEDYFVVDADNNEWLQADGKRVKIAEVNK